MDRIASGAIDLEATLYSGQAFRWRPVGGGWHEGFVKNRPIRLRLASAAIEFVGDPRLDASALRSYLRLDGTHDRFLSEVRHDGPLDRALAAFPGLRLLAQDPWEMFVSYIVSANSNVAKISRTLEALAALAGEPCPGPRCRFPVPEALARLSEDQLRSTGMGYRAPYLRAAARLVAHGDLDLEGLRERPYEDAHARLVEVPGVGAKVADCILLYGCGQFGAFPIDVWIDRVLREEYLPRRRMNYRSWGSWARAHFGPWAGYAQHFLFHERRMLGRAPRALVTPARPRGRSVPAGRRARA